MAETGAASLDVGALRRDFDLLCKNIPSRLTSRRNIAELRDVVRKVEERHDKMISTLAKWDRSNEKLNTGRLREVWWLLIIGLGELAHSLEWKGGVVQDTAARIAELTALHPDTDWQAYFRSHPAQTPEELDAGEIRRIAKSATAAKRRVQRRARATWAAMEGYAWLFDVEEPPDFSPPKEETVRIGGQTFILMDFDAHDPKDNFGSDFMRRLPEMVAYYEARCRVVAPELLRRRLPVRLYLDSGGGGRDECGDNAAACYQYHFISFTNWGLMEASTPKKFARILAHEMGHHMLFNMPRKSRQFWEGAILGDLGELDVEALAAMRLPDEAMSDFDGRIKREHPMLWLQVESLMHHYTTDNLSVYSIGSLLRAHSKGEVKGRLRVPGTPITGYANKNPDEAFCEALALSVAYGPRALHGKIRRLLEVILKGSGGWNFHESRAQGFLGLFEQTVIGYHGTNAGVFDKFQLPSKGHNSNLFGSWDITRYAAFFATEPAVAARYGSRVEEYEIDGDFLDMKTMAPSVALANTLEDHGISRYWLSRLWGRWQIFDEVEEGGGGQPFVDALRKCDYDGAVFWDTDGEVEFLSYAVFNPDCIVRIGAVEVPPPVDDAEEGGDE